MPVATCGVLACSQDVPPYSHFTYPTIGDTGDEPQSRWPLICDDDYLNAPDDLEEATQVDGSAKWLRRVVKVSDNDSSYVCLAIYFPGQKDRTLYSEGAPVAITAVPAMKGQEVAGSQLDYQHNMIEVQPIYPGWDLDGCTTSGDIDVGGVGAAASIRDAIRFATGELTTTDGYTLGQLVGMPVCAERVVVLGASNGAGVAHLALASWPGMLDGRVAGLALHEAPPTPQFTLQDVGAIWLDADFEVDADGNGVPWDDGANPSYEIGACRTYDTCELDYSRMNYAKRLRIDQIFPNRYNSNYPRGVIYFDANQDGHLNHLPAGTTDMNENGAVDPLEDFVFIPQWDASWLDSSRMYYSPEVLDHLDQVFNEDDWPENIATVEAADEFWSIRSPLDFIDTITQAYRPPFRVVVEFTEIDHGIPQYSHPHVWVFNEMYLNAGARVRINGAMDMLECSVPVSALADWVIDLPPNTRVPESEMQQYAIPEDVSSTRARAASVLSVLWDVYGPFDRCPSLDFN